LAWITKSAKGLVMEFDSSKIPPAELERVKALNDKVKDDIKHWQYAFDRMKRWRDFARGLQWPATTKKDLADPERQYTANITMRHLKQRAATIYAKNPTYNFKKSKRMNSLIWDGTAQQLLMANQAVMQGLDLDGSAAMIVEDAMASRMASMQTDRIGRTATYLYQYFIREQTPPSKLMMKKQILTAFTCGVGYFKQTFQRQMDLPPDAQRAISDHLQRLAKIERLTADMQEGEFTNESAEAEELRALIADLEKTPEIVLREGLSLDFPDCVNIIPEKTMTYLPGFIGCNYVTEQYCLTRDQIMEIYKVDVKDYYTAYGNRSSNDPKGKSTGDDIETARVFEIWDRTDGLIYTICDGYPAYLREPYSPITYTERFFPWFVYAPNAVDDPDDPFPPSDVELLMPMQMEINRAGESLRDHRYAARPGHVTGSNIAEEDQKKIAARQAHQVLVLRGLEPNEDIRNKFQPFPANPIDMNLYQTGPAFQDILRSVGTQEANLGGTSGSTATEAGIAEASRQSTTDSAIDELDDLLTEMARAGGQILIQEMSEEKVKEIVGPGALWPQQTSRAQVAKEILLEVVAGSSGRKNQMQEVQVRERIMPLMFQIPGIKHEAMGKDLLRVLDDGVEYEDWIDMDALPIVAMNGKMQAEANRGVDQGAEGGNNAEKPPAPGPSGPARPGQNGAGPIPVSSPQSRVS
jgi:hypothetical protein